jgi:hypothetical protein
MFGEQRFDLGSIHRQDTPLNHPSIPGCPGTGVQFGAGQSGQANAGYEMSTGDLAATFWRHR